MNVQVCSSDQEFDTMMILFIECYAVMMQKTTFPITFTLPSRGMNVKDWGTLCVTRPSLPSSSSLPSRWAAASCLEVRSRYAFLSVAW